MRSNAPHHSGLRGFAVLTGLLVSLSVALLRADAPALPPAIAPFHVGYSARLFPGLNENDAKTGIRLWAQTIGRAQNMPVNPDTPTLNGNTAIIDAFDVAKLDGITLLADEYWSIRDQVRLGLLVLAVRRHRSTDQFVLLVRQDRPLLSLRDLRNGTLAVLNDSRSILGGTWLETQLLAQGLGTAQRFWSHSTDSGSASKIVLSVFFNKADACLTTREAFQTMVELNPQVGRQLRVLEESAEMVPIVFCFRADLEPETLRRLELAIPSLHTSTAGQQVLTLFQSEDIVIASASAMDSACALLDRHQALKLADAEGNAP